MRVKMVTLAFRAARRPWRCLLVAWAGSALLAACGSSAPAEPPKTPASTTPSPPENAGANKLVNGNRFFDPVTGVSIDKLPNWAFMSLDAEVANRRAVSVGKAETDEHMHDGATPPLVVIARYPEPSEKPNPTLKITLRPLGELRGVPALDVTRAVAQVMAGAVPSFALDGEIAPARVSGLDAGTFRAHFTLEVPRLGRSFVIKTQAWIVPRGDDGFIIAVSDPTNGAENYEADLEAMVSTVVIRS